MKADMFMKIEGIDGDTTNEKHPKEIQVSRFDWGAFQFANLHEGTGGGVGKAMVGDISLIHDVSSATPPMLNYLVTGKHVPSVKLVAYKSGGESAVPYFTISLNTVVITEVQMEFSGGVPQQRTRLHFDEYMVDFTIQQKDGASAGSTSFGQTISLGKPKK